MNLYRTDVFFFLAISDPLPFYKRSPLSYIKQKTNIIQEAIKMKQPLFLKPVFQERIWGGTALKENFGYDIPSEHTGECWAISGHLNGPSIVKNGPYAGKSLIELWDNHRGLFGNYDSKVFTLLTTILDANAYLSVQVHPADNYAA